MGYPDFDSGYRSDFSLFSVAITYPRIAILHGDEQNVRTYTARHDTRRPNGDLVRDDTRDSHRVPVPSLVSSPHRAEVCE